MAVSVTFLTPLGALLALAALVPLLVLVTMRKHAGRVRHRLGIRPPRPYGLIVGLAALVSAGVLLGSAAAQPVLERTETAHVRTDAEVFVVIDVSRSMLASRDERSAARIDRAKVAVAQLQASLPDVPVGIASLTDRVLPHLFPTADGEAFQATLDRSIGIERPPPRQSLLTNVTDLSVLASMRGQRFFSPVARHRLAIVYTDGESAPLSPNRIGAIYRRPPKIDLVVVHVWHDDERVFTRGVPEQYRPDPTSRSLLDSLAEATRGRVLSERDSRETAEHARDVLGSGPSAERGLREDTVALAPYLLIAAFVPFGLLVWRRDL